MKRLKVLIITEGDELCSETVQIVSQLISSLESGADFHYAKSFYETLRNRSNILVEGYYDAVFMAANESSLMINAVIDRIFLADRKTILFFFSSSYRLVDEIKNRENVRLSFLLNEEKKLSGYDFEKTKNVFIMRGKISSEVSKNKLSKPVLIFSVLLESELPTNRPQEKCDVISLRLNSEKIKYAVATERCHKNIFAEACDLISIKDFARSSHLLQFWNSWITVSFVMGAYDDLLLK